MHLNQFTQFHVFFMDILTTHENIFIYDFMDYLTFHTTFMDKKTSSEIDILPSDC